MYSLTSIRISLLLLSIWAFNLTSCKKSEEKPTVVPLDTCVVVKATQSRTGLSPGNTTMIFEYNSQQLLVKKRYQFEGESSESVITFTYDENKRLIKSDYNGAGAYTEQYEYNSKGQWVKSKRQYDTYSETTMITYDGNGNRSRMDIEDSEGRKAYHTYTYSDGNLIEDSYMMNGVKGSFSYEYYLDKPNTVKEGLLPIYNLSSTNKNLAKKARATNPNVDDIEFSYEFNEKGLISKVISGSSQFHTISTYEYKCN
jgi:hypothetical protein